MVDKLFAGIKEIFREEKCLKSSERGSVYLVRNMESGERFIYRDYIGSGDVYRIMQGLECSNLPRIIHVEQNGERCIVLEEFIQGDTLASLMSDSAIPEKYALSIIFELCRALDAMHSIGIVHRDIKPENVILRGSEAVLIDFDASRLMKPERNSDTIAMGTAGYAAPEQYGFAQTDARADIYALGVLFNEILIRRHPSIQLAEGKYLPVISKCIEVNINRRFSTVRELLAALNELEEDKRGEKRRRSFYRWTAFILIAALLLGGAVYGYGKRQSAEEASLSEQELPYGTPPPQIGYYMDFEYDIDGDGKTEDYIFGVAFSDMLKGELIFDERIGVRSTDKPNRAAFPCVWKLDESGVHVPADEFIDLLEDARICLSCYTDPDLEQPYTRIPPVKWRGGLQIFYSSKHVGVWVYQASATLDGMELTAAASTDLYLLN